MSCLVPSRWVLWGVPGKVLISGASGGGGGYVDDGHDAQGLSRLHACPYVSNKGLRVNSLSLSAFDEVAAPKEVKTQSDMAEGAFYLPNRARRRRIRGDIPLRWHPARTHHPLSELVLSTCVPLALSTYPPET